MDLVNTTPAAVLLRQATRQGRRLAAVHAKLTFRASGGAVVVDADDPVPVLTRDRETPLGPLPADLPAYERAPGEHQPFQVFILGQAHAPDGQPTSEMTVTARIGTVTRQLRVVGDRRWLEDGLPVTLPTATLGRKPEIGPPAPFQSLPLTAERALGGTAWVRLDRTSTVPVYHPDNPAGRGMLVDPHLVALAAAVRGPAGFPRPRDPRELPNIEDPAAPIARWTDQPIPVWWGALATQSALIAERARGATRGASRHGDAMAVPPTLQALSLRAHPDWVIAIPPGGVGVEIDGMTPAGSWGFRLPSILPLADYDIDGRQGHVHLVPRSLVLLPEEGRFTMTFGALINMSWARGRRRMLRLRLAPGWCGPDCRHHPMSAGGADVDSCHQGQ